MNKLIGQGFSTQNEAVLTVDSRRLNPWDHSLGGLLQLRICSFPTYLHFRWMLIVSACRRL